MRNLPTVADETADVDSYSYFSPELHFLHGYCLLADLKYDEADHALKSFLNDYPGAPLRLTITAKQMIGELANRQPERIGEVVDLMTYARRRLALGNAGRRVQQRQERVVELLDRLIEEAEEQEKNSSSTISSRYPGPNTISLLCVPLPG